MGLKREDFDDEERTRYWREKFITEFIEEKFQDSPEKAKTFLEQEQSLESFAKFAQNSELYFLMRILDSVTPATYMISPTKYLSATIHFGLLLFKTGTYASPSYRSTAVRCLVHLCVAFGKLVRIKWAKSFFVMAKRLARKLRDNTLLAKAYLGTAASHFLIESCYKLAEKLKKGYTAAIRGFLFSFFHKSLKFFVNSNFLKSIRWKSGGFFNISN